MGDTVIFTPEEFSSAAIEVREELLTLPQMELSRLFPFVSIITGVNSKLLIGEVNGDFQLGPYTTQEGSDKFEFKGRTLEVFLGSLIEKFNPDDMRKSYWNTYVKGDFESIPFAQFLLMLLIQKVSKNLYKVSFSADRKGTGSGSSLLFDGWDTIAQAEITSGNISSNKGNLYEFKEVVSNTNALDSLLAFYRSASSELREEDTYMYIDTNIYDMYNDDYAATYGGANFTKDFEQPKLIGSSGKCTLVPVSCKAGSSLIQLTTKENMVIGFDGQGNLDETVTIEKHHPFVYDFVAKLAIGTQYRMIGKEILHVGKLKTV